MPKRVSGGVDRAAAGEAVIESAASSGQQPRRWRSRSCRVITPQRAPRHVRPVHQRVGCGSGRTTRPRSVRRLPRRRPSPPRYRETAWCRRPLRQLYCSRRPGGLGCSLRAPGGCSLRAPGASQRMRNAIRIGDDLDAVAPSLSDPQRLGELNDGSVGVAASDRSITPRTDALAAASSIASGRPATLGGKPPESRRVRHRAHPLTRQPAPLGRTARPRHRARARRGASRSLRYVKRSLASHQNP